VAARAPLAVFRGIAVWGAAFTVLSFSSVSIMALSI
jgi:hypothetical protein